MEQNKLPAGWSWVKLGEVSEINSGIGFPKKHQGKKNEKYPFFKVGDISNNVREGKRYLEVYDNSISEDDLWEIKGRITEPHSVVFAKIGEALKLNRRAITKENCLVDNNVMSVKVLESKLNYIYLYYFLLVQNLGELSRSTTVPSIRKSDVENILIPLPPLIEQQKIVDKIEELFSELDNGVANLKKTKEQIKVYKQSVLKYAFEGKLVEGKMQYGKGKSENGGLPEGWKWRKLGEISDIINGYAFKSSHFSTDGDYQVIKIGNVRPINLRLEERPAFVSDVDQKIREKYLLRNNDLVISLTGTRKKRDYGFVALVKQSDLLLLNQRLAAIRLIENYNPLYFLYLLSINIFLDQFFSYETGNVGQGNVGIKGIKESVLPIPPLSEQTQIVEEIERRFSVADKLEAAIDESLKKAEGLRQSILKQAFEGKLV